jgi:hypothetical protein
MNFLSHWAGFCALYIVVLIPSVIVGSHAYMGLYLSDKCRVGVVDPRLFGRRMLALKGGDTTQVSVALPTEEWISLIFHL